MGIVHKLKPEVLNFILENKQKDPALSCRILTQLIFEKLQVKVSKSSINSIFKEYNLSMPIGRRQKQKKKFNLPVLPVIEGTKAVTVVTPPQAPPAEKPKEEMIPEQKKEEISPEEKRIKEAEEWAMKLHEEERIRVEEKLKSEQQPASQEDLKKKADEAEVRALLEEAAQVKEQEEANLRAEEEKAAQEAALEAEKEKWARLAEEEHKAKQLTVNEPAQDKNLLGTVLLEALDYLVGTTKEINAAICKQMGASEEISLPLTRAMIFKSLGIRQYPVEIVDNYSAQVKQLSGIKTDIVKIINQAFTQARGVKIHFIDGNVVYLDGQLHTSWPTEHIPYDFCSASYELKNNLNKYFFQGQPLVLFSAPGYDVAPKDFFNLLLNIGSTDKYPDTVTLFANKAEEIEKIFLDTKNNYSLFFGLWPWQFTSARKVKRIGDFSLKRIQGVDKDFYLADIEIDLLRVSANQSISLKGCAVKTTPAEKIRLVILSNPQRQMNIEELAEIYLSRWPDFDEVSHDFSRKTELFVYASAGQKFFSVENSGVDIQAPKLELEGVFEGYIKILDAYLRWYFLPSGYAQKDFSFTSENFYKIPLEMVTLANKTTVRMQVEQGYPLLKDLEYLIHRLNERRINSPAGQRLYFENAFK